MSETNMQINELQSAVKKGDLVNVGGKLTAWGSPAADKYIIGNVDNYSYKDMANQFGVSIVDVVSKVRKLRKDGKVADKKKNVYKSHIDRDDEAKKKILRNYKSMTDDQLSKMTGYSAKLIKKFMVDRGMNREG